MKALLEVIKEYRKENENPIKAKDARINEATRLLNLERDRARALAASNEELKRSESLALHRPKPCMGKTRWPSLTPRSSWPRHNVKLPCSKTTTDAAKDAASAKSMLLSKPQRPSRTLQGRSRCAGDAADALGAARSNQAKQLFKKDQGINQFLRGGALGARRKKASRCRRTKQPAKKNWSNSSPNQQFRCGAAD